MRNEAIIDEQYRQYLIDRVWLGLLEFADDHINPEADLVAWLRAENRQIEVILEREKPGMGVSISVTEWVGGKADGHIKMSMDELLAADELPLPTDINDHGPSRLRLEKVLVVP